MYTPSHQDRGDCSVMHPASTGNLPATTRTTRAARQSLTTTVLGSVWPLTLRRLECFGVPGSLWTNKQYGQNGSADSSQL